MSLKNFHIFFILCSFALMLFVARSGQCAPAAWIGAGLSAAYFGWFLRRYKTLS